MPRTATHKAAAIGFFIVSPPSCPPRSWTRHRGRFSLVTVRLVFMLRIEQPMHVDNEIAHVRVVDGLLGLRLPGCVSCRIVGINAHNVEPVEILELDLGEILELAAKYEMKQLLARGYVRHGQSSSRLLKLAYADCLCYLTSISHAPHARA